MISHTISDSNDMFLKRSNFYQSVNTLMANFGTLQSSIISQLFDSYCTSFYGSQMWNLTCSSINIIYTAWNKAIRRIWRLPIRCHTNLLPFINNSHHIKDGLLIRFAKLYHAMETSNNKLASFFARLGTLTANSEIGRNVHFIFEEYGIWIHKSDLTTIKTAVNTKYEDVSSEECYIESIPPLLEMYCSSIVP